MEVICKRVMVVFNRRLGMAITFHDVFHGLLSGIGIGTASLEAKMLQQLISMR